MAGKTVLTFKYQENGKLSFPSKFSFPFLAASTNKQFVLEEAATDRDSCQELYESFREKH